MKSVGQELREAREAMGLSISDAAALTRIPRTTLELLEQGRFEEFKSSVFVRGHLRNYANELRLDPERLVSRYEGPSARSSDSVSIRRTSKDASSSRSDITQAFQSVKSSVRPQHMLAILLVFIGAIMFASLLSGTHATAKDPVEFPQTNQQDWELEQDVQETRWLLEQPVQDSKR